MSHIGEMSLQVDLRPSVVQSMDELLSDIDVAAAATPDNEWVIGAGYDQNFLGDRHPTAEQLDAVSHGHPVYLVHASRHMGVANTKAFELAGYPQRHNVPIPEGGAVPMDA